MTASISKSIDCATASEFWSQLAPENPLTPAPNDFVYRGQCDADWALIPSVLRRKNGHPTIVEMAFPGSLTAGGDQQIFAEHRILQLFVEACDRVGLALPNDSSTFRRNWIERNASHLDHAMKGVQEWPPEELFDLLALAQHHALPTRLLDWSRRAHVAVYFAAVDAVRSREFSTSRRLAVWALDLECRGLMPKLDVVRVPGSTSRNLAPQEGLFTLLREKMQRGIPYLPLGLVEYIHNEFAHDPQACPLWRLTVPWSEAPKLLDLCDKHGVTGAILFPGYDGAATAAFDSVLRSHRERTVYNQEDGS